MAIQLGDPINSANEPWNEYLLIIFWILQFATTAYFEVSLGIVVLLMTAFGAGASLLFGLPTFLANLAVLGCIIHEWRLLQGGCLTSTSYYRFQAAKSIYFLVILALLFLPALKSTGFFGTLWRFSTFVAPFWGAFWYSYDIRKTADGFEGEGWKAWW